MEQIYFSNIYDPVHISEPIVPPKFDSQTDKQILELLTSVLNSDLDTDGSNIRSLMLAAYEASSP